MLRADRRVQAGDAFGGETRARDGVIVTICDEDTGELRSYHRHGLVDEVRHGTPRIRLRVGVREVLADFCVEVDRMEGSWKIVSISTPSTIYSDVTHRGNGTGVLYPEVEMLRRISRIDLLGVQPAQTEHELQLERESRHERKHAADR